MSEAHQSTDDEVRDCSEGCDDDGHTHRWEISPCSKLDFDVYVCDSDEVAIEKLLEIAEMTWDQIEPGEERTITIRRNAV